MVVSLNRLLARCFCRRSVIHSILLACSVMAVLSLMLLLHAAHLLHSDRRAVLHASQQQQQQQLHSRPAADVWRVERGQEWGRSGGEQGQKCQHPVLDPQDPSVMQFYQKEPPVDCRQAMEDWVYVTNGTFRISRLARQLYGKITCEYAPLVRGDDFSARHAPHVKPMPDGRQVVTDFFKVACVSSSGKRYINIHSSVAWNPAVWARLKAYHHHLNFEDGDSSGGTDHTFGIAGRTVDHSSPAPVDGGRTGVHTAASAAPVRTVLGQVSDIADKGPNKTNVSSQVLPKSGRIVRYLQAEYRNRTAVHSYLDSVDSHRSRNTAHNSKGIARFHSYASVTANISGFHNFASVTANISGFHSGVIQAADETGQSSQDSVYNGPPEIHDLRYSSGESSRVHGNAADGTDNTGVRILTVGTSDMTEVLRHRRVVSHQNPHSPSHRLQSAASQTGLEQSPGSADMLNQRPGSPDMRPLTYKSLNLSVFMFGFDSLSRMAWIRLLPKTRDFFLKELAGIELSAYNIVGDGTPAALLPILTGKMEEELPEARRGFPGASSVDDHPWVWRNFSQHGYVTAHAEDMASVGTFQYRMLGFRDQPTDHNMRTFYLAAERMYKHNSPLCLGSRPRHVNFMNWFRDLFSMYRPFPKFFFGFHSEMSHDLNNKVQALDNDMVSFLKDLEQRGHLNATLLILMADHGARYNYIRATAQGKIEERMPYFSFRFPPWFRKVHPEIVWNMEINSHRLTTPFDIHETFLEVLNFTGAGLGDIRRRGISLFKEVPKERTCSHAGITPHWCACLGWESVHQSSPLVMEAVQAAIRVINEYTDSVRNVCVELALQEITHSARYVPNADDLSVESKLYSYRHRHRQDYFAGTTPSLPSSSAVELYQVTFRTLPGLGHFEVTCTRDIISGTFVVRAKDISRINKYGTQPQCVQEKMPHLRPYCYCADV